jgi:MFS family permease
VLADEMGDESRVALMILLENLARLAALPLWLSKRIGKHRALMAAALWLAALSLPLGLLREVDSALLIATVVISGSSFASILFLANSIAAEVIDVDTLASGEQRSGLYAVARGTTINLSLALGVLLGTLLPSRLGLRPGGTGHSPAHTGAPHARLRPDSRSDDGGGRVVSVSVSHHAGSPRRGPCGLGSPIGAPDRTQRSPDKGIGGC